MACATCDHTMQSIVTANDYGTLFWCPRCGTLKRQAPGGQDEWFAPKIVARALALCDAARNGAPAGRTFSVIELSLRECCLPACGDENCRDCPGCSPLCPGDSPLDECRLPDGDEA